VLVVCVPEFLELSVVLELDDELLDELGVVSLELLALMLSDAIEATCWVVVIAGFSLIIPSTTPPIRTSPTVIAITPSLRLLPVVRKPFILFPFLSYP
jgi:hypothetical protein